VGNSGAQRGGREAGRLQKIDMSPLFPTSWSSPRCGRGGVWNHDRHYGKKSQPIRRPVNRALRLSSTHTKGVEQFNLNVLVTSLNVLAIAIFGS
jgi:hypothetical protein